LKLTENQRQAGNNEQGLLTAKRFIIFNGYNTLMCKGYSMTNNNGLDDWI
jgi:hypothetical protein